MSGSTIIHHLLNRSPVILGFPLPVTKQYLDFAPQAETPPYIIISDVGGSDGLHLLGMDRYPVDRVQIDHVCTSPVDARNLCSRVNDVLTSSFKRTITHANLKVKDVDIYEAGRPYSIYVDGREFSAISQDFYVRWRYQ